MTNTTSPSDLVLVTGGTGKTGRRIAARLETAGVPVRIGSRHETPAFEWNDPATWTAALHGATGLYLAYAPDLAVPGAAETVAALAEQAAAAGVRRIVLLSGRGEPEAQRAEVLVRAAGEAGGAAVTVVRASWFAQNFSEDFLADDVQRGEIVLPAGAVAEPFIDAGDIAEIAAEALLSDRHAGALYEVTGPELLTFSDVAAALSSAAGRQITYVPVTLDEYVAGAREQGLPEEMLGALTHLFAEVLDGRNESLASGVQEALGRPPRRFADYAREAAASGVWASGAEVGR